MTCPLKTVPVIKLVFNLNWTQKEVSHAKKTLPTWKRSSNSSAWLRLKSVRVKPLAKPANSWGLPSKVITAGVKEYGGLQINQAKRLKDLGKENSRLKKLVADLSLDKDILNEALRGNY